MKRVRAARRRKRVAVITGTRAEYGLLRSPIEAINAHPLLELQLIATQHLELSHELELTESLTYARYLLGLYHYERNELA